LLRNITLNLYNRSINVTDLPAFDGVSIHAAKRAGSTVEYDHDEKEGIGLLEVHLGTHGGLDVSARN
jgi:hypothetical protein